MKLGILLFGILLALSGASQPPEDVSTLEVYSTVAPSFKVDVSHYMNGQSIYPAPLEKGRKLVHTVHSKGKFTLLAKITNGPGFRSKSLELDIFPGKRNVVVVGAIKTGEYEGTVLLTDITDNAKQLAKLEAQQDEWTTVESE
jgi:hypothetical protein